MQLHGQLCAVLDAIWQGSDDRTSIARKSVSRLTEVDLLILAAWDLVSLVPQCVSEIDMSTPPDVRVYDKYGRMAFSATLKRKGDLGGQVAFVDYTDALYCIVVRDTAIPLPPNAVRRRSFSSLLLAMQLVRDHLDSVTLLPPELRERRLAEFASISAMDLLDLKSLSAAFPVVRSCLECYASAELGDSP